MKFQSDSVSTGWTGAACELVWERGLFPFVITAHDQGNGK